MATTNYTYTHEEPKSALNSRTACYHTVYNRYLPVSYLNI